MKYGKETDDKRKMMNWLIFIQLYLEKYYGILMFLKMNERISRHISHLRNTLQYVHDRLLY